MRLKAHLEVEIEIRDGHVVPIFMTKSVVHDSLKDAVEFHGKDGIEHDLATIPTITVIGFSVIEETE